MNKVCLVTGAKKGICFAITEKLLEYGYKVIMADCKAITEVKSDSNFSVVKSYITKEKDLLKQVKLLMLLNFYYQIKQHLSQVMF